MSPDAGSARSLPSTARSSSARRKGRLLADTLDARELTWSSGKDEDRVKSGKGGEASESCTRARGARASRDGQ
jgi:hypothetical protein